ncbi:MAG: hypothetical protein HZC40_00820 [Chloroflexi bacterium]|nr:hypothetical protein [Chloroflexota bacterium]
MSKTQAIRGRPRLACRVRIFRVQFSLREGEEDDLIRFFEAIPARRLSSALKTALRAGGMRAAQTADEDDEDELLDSVDSFFA